LGGGGIFAPRAKDGIVPISFHDFNIQCWTAAQQSVFLSALFFSGFSLLLLGLE